jgi:hypothetical protein
MAKELKLHSRNTLGICKQGGREEFAEQGGMTEIHALCGNVFPEETKKRGDKSPKT